MTTSLRRRDRVAMALNHETPDRCPMQISFTPEFAERLRADLKLDTSQMHNPHGAGNTYELERATNQDMLLVSIGWLNSYHWPPREYTDDWGVHFTSIDYTTRFGTGRYTEVTGRPLADDNAIASYRTPDPHRPELYKDAEDLIRNYGNEYWIIGNVNCTIFETAWALRGMDNLLMDMMVAPDRADHIFDLCYQYHRVVLRRLVEMGVDMVWTGDDVGTQRGLMFSLELWRRYLKPRMAELYAELKAINKNIKIAYHSDGSVEPLIPELIEIGLDVLNPVQPACMDPARLKKLYGDKLSFWGSICEQHTLPYGTPEDVRREVLSRLKNVGYNGGLIIGPTHNVQLDTPMENFWAMMETIQQATLSD